MQHLRLRVARNVQCFREKTSVRGGGLFHFASLDFVAADRDFFYRLVAILIRDPKHRADHALFFPPRRSDFGNGFVTSHQPALQDAGDHHQRN